MTNGEADGCFGLFIIFSIIASVVVLYPLLIIWSLNTLFSSLNIAYTLKTWFAISILSGFLYHFIYSFIKSFVKSFN